MTDKERAQEFFIKYAGDPAWKAWIEESAMNGAKHAMLYGHLPDVDVRFEKGGIHIGTVCLICGRDERDE